MFKKIEKTQFPPRQWAIVGHPGCGKSTFGAQMTGPLLVIDSDHRFREVAHLAVGDVFQLSDNPADNVSAETIAHLLRTNMASSGVKTIVIDSLTSIITPLTIQAILDNDAGRNKNRVAAFKDKALAMRLLQDSITGTGTDTLWVYHMRNGLDGSARQVESTSISPIELARLRRSLNLQLRVVTAGDKRGLKVDWARRGRQGMTLWDDSGAWVGMPAKIEQAVYGGLSQEEMKNIESLTPTSFTGPEAAIAWGLEQGCYRDAVHAQNAYAKVKREKQPKTPEEMWVAWTAEVQSRLGEQVS